MAKFRTKKPTLPKKPPTQIVGVEGFVASTVNQSDTQNIYEICDWLKLSGLPAFAMYAQESAGVCGDTAIKAWIESQVLSLGAKEFYQDYANWHTNKGYWLGETPMGELLDGNY